MREHSTSPRVHLWHRQTSDAISLGDRRALRTIRASVTWGLMTMQGRELSEARALLARIEAQRATAPKRTAWRLRQRPTTRSSHTATQGTHAWMQNRLKPSPRNCSPP